ncbi:ATPase, partial [Kitasatospora sp. DSM 101779]|nr:ATPase [Kitasatospora sp. DSM 101779]
YAGLFAVEGIGAAVRGPVDHNRALLAAAAGDRAAADRHAAAARTLAAAAGMPEPAPTPTSAPAPAPAAESSEPVGAPAVFRFDGGRWLLRYAGREAGLPDSKGLRDLAVLLARPGTPVPALDLATAVTVGHPGRDHGGLHRPADTGELIDATARAAYRRRLRELAEETEEADAAGDAERSARLAVEQDALLGQLSAAYGLGGRARRTGSAAERARTAVTARIRTAVSRITAVHPELGRHLQAAVRTGTFCEYRPEQAPPWRL